MILYKYCANGNDFLIFHTFVRRDYAPLARALCHRFSGIGADGLVVVLPCEADSADSRDLRGADSSAFVDSSARVAYEWDFYNADGSSANMCGNASRCVAHYAYSVGLAGAKHSFLSKAGIIRVSVEADGKNAESKNAESKSAQPQSPERTAKTAIVSSNLGVYKDFREIGALADNAGIKLDSALLKEVESTQGLARDLCAASWFYLNTGVPHLVCFVRKRDIIEALRTKQEPIYTPLFALLRALRQAYNANVNIACLDSSLDSGARESDMLESSANAAPNNTSNQALSKIYLATYERGVEDITLACGTGMAACFVVGKMHNISEPALLIPPSLEPLEIWSESAAGAGNMDSASSLDFSAPESRNAKTKNAESKSAESARDTKKAIKAIAAKEGKEAILIKGRVHCVALCDAYV
ncbi:hypothetical protein BKN38_04460 [Helicobacter sp. CLO-3]|uniref:hypothetical protein n=1 Tax=unclassified Helicobacter TaxID=2593540 RepID=UPI000804FA1D|nr:MULTISPECIES: hypothetical protein [unclassified Helicobacter]OBV29948.1 hypothetical protein BA723_03440 [Helicobacter sp. CLO-3]OHU83949.1 hypothetical protein BKN38_04460 [Helicobacter sp. CLO-3]